MKLFADRSYLCDGCQHVELLAPFWGLQPERDTPPRYDRYVARGSQYFRLTPLADAQIAIYPAKWETARLNPSAVELAHRLASVAGQVGKKVVIFFWHDSEEPVKVANSVIFRTSLSGRARREHEYAMPAWSEDFVEHYLGGVLPIRRKDERPRVTFCGYAPRARLRERLQGLRQGVRERALRQLAATDGVFTRYLIRDRFNEGSRDEYVSSILDGDYVLCARGAGNFSYRLYEVLSCGRIPVFVNTDCVLPYELEIDWRALCVWVDHRELASIGERVLAFHTGLSASEFEDRQRECRRVWENWLSPEGFFANFHRHFAAEATRNAP